MCRLPGDLYDLTLPAFCHLEMVLGWTPRYSAASRLVMYRVIANDSIPGQRAQDVTAPLHRWRATQDLLSGKAASAVGVSSIRSNPASTGSGTFSAVTVHAPLPERPGDVRGRGAPLLEGAPCTSG